MLVTENAAPASPASTPLIGTLARQRGFPGRQGPAQLGKNPGLVRQGGSDPRTGQQALRRHDASPH